MKKIIFSLLALSTLFILAACSSGEASGDKKELKIGATSGPYADQLKESIIPLLEKDGYKVKLVEFNDYIQPNRALEEGSIDANVFQTSVYLEAFNKEHKTNLAIGHAVPTAPIGLYSEKHKDVSDVKEGMKLTLSNDPVSMARALQMLERFGWITLAGEIDQTRASEKDIVDNKYNLDIVAMDGAQLPRSLGDTDFAFINGNFAIASGLNLEDAVQLEDTPPEFMNNIAYHKDNLDETFAEAIKKAYHSEAFLKYTNENNAGFTKPDYQNE
jgi:D-methionine transport system substrate-binding protein